MRRRIEMRVDLRLGDLRSRGQIASKLMNVKIPSEVNQKIQRVAEALKASKTEVVIALLNEGLDISEGLTKKTPRGHAKVAAVVQRRGRRAGSGAKACSAAGCNEKAVAKGLCPKHYQAARRRRMGW
jgi:hypothetical protein